uniref:EF-hand domain-containing protein n=1 Tax=Rhizochromulina marina TaxID=1034831 RepID=A0A7S2R6C3_9STRA|mmetsp:Transcript_1175/g.3712  ORF Transcript_1175/g.3712 Transcript_1175/m.3712 type:complete len:484 (+) Transcript_1175:541-1992(+)
MVSLSALRFWRWRVAPWIELRTQHVVQRWLLPSLSKEQLVGMVAAASSEMANREVLSQLSQLPPDVQREAKIIVDQTAKNLQSKLLLLADEDWDVSRLVESELKALYKSGSKLDPSTEQALRQILRVQLDLIFSGLLNPSSNLLIGQQLNETVTSLTTTATELVDGYQQQLRAAISTLDVNGDGVVTLDELSALVPTLELSLTTTASEVMGEYQRRLQDSLPPDVADSAATTLESYQRRLLSTVPPLETSTLASTATDVVQKYQEQLRSLLSRLDRNGDGFITLGDITSLLPAIDNSTQSLLPLLPPTYASSARNASSSQVDPAMVSVNLEDLFSYYFARADQPLPPEVGDFFRGGTPQNLSWIALLNTTLDPLTSELSRGLNTSVKASEGIFTKVERDLKQFVGDRVGQWTSSRKLSRDISGNEFLSRRMEGVKELVKDATRTKTLSAEVQERTAVESLTQSIMKNLRERRRGGDSDIGETK